MMLEKGAEIQVLRAFCSQPFEPYSLPSLAKVTGLSLPWLYQVTNKLRASSLLVQAGKSCRLDFSRPFCQQLKLLFDMEYLTDLSQDEQKRIFTISQKIIFTLRPKALVLVGSVAMGKQRKASDLDFLIVSEDSKRPQVPLFPNCNLVLFSPQQLEQKYHHGDDFVLSALLFGKILYDEHYFINFFSQPLPLFSEEVIQEKLAYCEKLQERIYALLPIDADQAGKELLFLLLQTARILLLRRRIVPRTKYELASQVRPFAPPLAIAIAKTLSGKRLGKEEIVRYVGLCQEVIA